MNVRVEVVDQARTRELRRTVLRPGFPETATLPGDDLPGAVHLAALEGDDVVGTCFVFPHACPWRPDVPDAWHLRQMATAEGWRGRGVGSAVLAAALEYVRSRGGRLLWCNAREPAVPFYRRHGLLTFGGVFTDEEHPIPHVRMELDLDPGDGGGT